MPRIPEGSWPPTERVRPVIVTELDNLLGFPYTTAPAVYPIVPADSVVSPVFDVLTPLYQGRGENETPTLANDEGWTRGLGIPGVNVSVEFRSASYVLDASIWCTRLCSVLFEWIYAWAVPGVDLPVIGSSYRWLPVKGSPAPSLDLVPVAQMIQGLRIPSPWFRYTFTNEDTVDILSAEVLLHVWLRGG